MAKLEGTQSIPAALLDIYRATLTEQQPDDTTRKRYPFRVPKMQAGGSGVTPKQRTQRNRFLGAKSRFADLSFAERQRWYAARPPWSSFLWYYNYFIMSSLTGNADINHGGAGVIKSIQIVKEEVPTTGTKSFTISEVDPDKTVVMLFGNSYISDLVQRGESSVAEGATKNIALSPNVDPAISEVHVLGMRSRIDISGGDGDGQGAYAYASALIAAQLSVKGPNVAGAGTYYFSWEIIEHKAQTIYPVLVSKAAEAVVIDWALVPSVAADISIIAIEYV